MSAYNLYLRVLVGATIASAFYFTRGFGSTLETFVMAVCAALVGHGVVWGVRWLAGSEKKTLAILAIVVTALGATAVFVAIDRTWPQGPIHYLAVDELMVAPDRFVDREIKLHGYLEIGSIRRRDGVLTFTLTERKQAVAVRVAGSVPDTLQDRAEVVARGTLRREAGGFVLVATDVMAKCPSTYNTADGPKPASQFR